MEYKTYKVKQGQYHEIIDSTITIPDGLKLITEEDQLGGWLHEGHKHYFGAIKGDLTQIEDNLKGLHVYPEQFGEYVLISILNIKFIEPYPYLVSEEEFNNEFDLSSYYITRYDDEFRIIDIDVLYNYRINQSSQTYHNNVSKKFSQFEEFAWNMNDLLSDVDFSEREVVVSAIYQRVNSYKYGMLTCYFCYRRELKHMLMILPESVNWERNLSRKALLILASRYGVFSPFMAVRTKVLVQNTIMHILRLIKRIIFK